MLNFADSDLPDSRAFAAGRWRDLIVAVPWSFPSAMRSRKIAPALAAGVSLTMNALPGNAEIFEGTALWMSCAAVTRRGLLMAMQNARPCPAVASFPFRLTWG